MPLKIEIEYININLQGIQKETLKLPFDRLSIPLLCLMANRQEIKIVKKTYLEINSKRLTWKLSIVVIIPLNILKGKSSRN